MFQTLILFHRRIILLTFTFVCVLAVLVLQTSRLMVMQGAQRLEKAQGRLHTTTYLPTWRGHIRDRKGRIIAEDVASYDVAVEWDYITGDRAVRLARQDARSSVGDDAWRSLSPERGQSLIDAFLPTRQSELEEFWVSIASESGIDRQDLEKSLTLIRDEVKHTVQVVWARQEELHKQRFPESVPFEAQPIREQIEPHVVLPRVDDELAMRFSLLSTSLDDAGTVQHTRQRDYPYRNQSVLIDRSTLPRPIRQFDTIQIELRSVAELIVGDVRGDVWAEDIQRRSFRSNGVVDLGGYRLGDEVGNRGLELSLEDYLRGA